MEKPDITSAYKRLCAYAAEKEQINSRFDAEERLWRLDSGDDSGASAYLHNVIASKHADAMDAYPKAVILPREKNDVVPARQLSEILPFLLDEADFYETYSKAWWTKLKHGTAAYGIFWEPEKAKVAIRELDLRRVFWEPGISDIQESRELFIVSAVPDNDLPNCRCDSSFSVPDGRKLVVDWYEKTGEGLRLVKFCGDTVLFDSGPGWYSHGQFPIVLDTLFPIYKSPVGYGYCAVCKSPQLYIDRLSGALLDNASVASKIRYFAKASAGVSREQFLDLDQPVVEVEGDLDTERLRPIETPQLGSVYIDMLKQKIDELRETAGVNDLTQGRVAGGLTAASAISALQEAGNKLGRDMISASYRAFCRIVTQVISIVLDFYDDKRYFRVAGDFKRLETSLFSGEIKPVFDVVVEAVKQEPFSRTSQNELSKELFRMGFFAEENRKEALMAAELMDFPGKEKLLNALSL